MQHSECAAYTKIRNQQLQLQLHNLYQPKYLTERRFCSLQKNFICHVVLVLKEQIDSLQEGSAEL